MPVTLDPNAVATYQNKPVTPAPDSVSLGEQVGAAFKLENVAVGAVDSLERESFTADPSFNVADHIRDDELIFARQLGRAQSEGELTQIRDEIENERKAREMLEAGPLNGFLAELLAVAGDPTSYVGFGVGASGRAGKLVTRLGRASGAAAAEVALAEVALQSQQQTRTLTESVSAVALGGAFGFGAGAVGAGLSRRAHRRAVRDYAALIEDTLPPGVAEAAPTPQSAGAARAGFTPEETKISRKAAATAARGLSKLKGVVAPSVELAASANAATRDIIGKFYDHVFVTEGNVKFKTVGATVDTQIKRFDAMRAAAFDAGDLHFKKFRANGGQLNKAQFFEEVGKAMRRNDASQVTEVAELAKWYRSNVITPLKDRAVKAGLLPEDVDVITADSYFTRIYNHEKINARLPEFLDRVEAYLRRTVPADEVAADAEYRSIAQDITNRILGAPGGRVPFINQALARGPLAERTFNIPDTDIEDFLINDVQRVGERYINTLVPDTILTEQFGRVDLDAQIKEIRADGDARAEAAKTEKERKSILDQTQREEDIVNALVQITRNMFDTPTSGSGIALRRAGRAIRTFNYLRLLGSVAISSIPDVGRIVMEEGLSRTFGTLIGDLGNGFRSIRMAKAEAQLAGTALDISLGTRAKAIYDIGEQYQSVSKFERGLDGASNAFGIANLLSPWNVALKSWSSAVVGTRILKATRAAADGTISQRDIERLAKAGIDEDIARRIAAQSKHFEDNGVALLGNTEDWTDPGAVEAFRNALLRDVDATIITPGAADAPIWTSKEFGKMVFQFKRFASASVNRIALGGLQAQDMAALNGILLMVGLGGAGRAALDLATTGEVEERSARKWLVESMDRSGVLGLYTEMDAISTKALGVSPLTALSGEEPSRFASRNLLGQIGGPLAGAIEDTAKAAQGAISGDFTQSDLHKLRRLAPGQNLLYIRSLLDKLEQSSGLPEKN